MKKILPLVKLLFTVVLGLSATRTFSQVANYTFLQSNSPFTPLATSTVVHTSSWDDQVSQVAIPFTFYFNGIGYTTTNVSANGYITFGATPPVGTTVNGFNPISSTTAFSGAVSAFGRDIVNGGLPIVSGIEGVSPNRVFVVQWNNSRRFNIDGDVLNFQIRLYESSNKAEVKYGTNTAISTNSLTTQVGLRGASNADYNNRTTTTNWNATTTGVNNDVTCTTSNGVMPASGLSFIWIPNAAVYCTPTYASGPGTVDVITNVTLGSLNNTSGASAFPYYTFYNNVTIPNIIQSSNVSISVKFGSDTAQFGAVWIDFNQNNIFEPSEGIRSTVSAGANGTSTFTFTVPSDALLGNTRMRVRGGDDTALTTAQACGATNDVEDGETEDYIINIVTNCAAVTGATAFTSSADTLGCGINPATTLTTSGGSAGTAGFSTLFYEGNTCPNISYVNEFLNAPSIDNSTVGTISNGNRTFTSTSVDPMIHFENVLRSAINPVKSKFVIVRYRVTTNPGPGNEFQIYFKKNNFDLAEARVVKQPINTDGSWHIATIDMSTNAEWNNDSGNIITGFRFDYASLSGTVMDIDYILLGDTPLLENTNANDATVLVNPSASTASTQYGTFRISECSGQVVACSTALNKTITNLDRTFSASTNSSWNTNTNWVQGLVPTSVNCVNIPNSKNIVVDVNTAAAKNIVVAAGGKLTINKDQVLTVKETFTNNAAAGDVMIESDGSLMQTDNVANTGAISARRKLTIKNNLEYNYLISPLIGTNLKTGIYEKNAGDARTTAPFTLYHVESTNTFVNSSGAYILGRGLAVKEPATGSGNVNMFFQGAPMNGSFTYTLENSNTAVRTSYGYNLIGNPYPSNIDLNKFFNLATNKVKISTTFYFWDNSVNSLYSQQGIGYSGSSYGIFNAVAGSTGTGTKAGVTTGTTQSTKQPTNIVKTGQGFMVRSLSTTNKIIDFDNTIRTPNLEPVFFGKTAQDDRFWLHFAAPSGVKTEIAVVYFANGNDSFSQDDSEILGNPSDAMYSIVDDHQVVINGKSSFTTSDKILLGTKMFSEGNYTISLGDVEGIFADTQFIYLRDKQTGMISNLSEGNYTFTANAGESTGRFEIVYKPETVLATNGATKENLIVYKDGNDFVVKAQSKKITNVEVFDTAGRLILSLNPNNLKAVIPAEKIVNGVYVLKIDQSGAVTTKKIIK